jgi:hypothetical protein
MSGGLIVQDFAGVHNADLAATSARIIKGGSWKKQRVVVVVPAADLIPAQVALSMWNLGFPPNNGVIRILAQGMEVGDAYSSAIEQVLAHPDLKDWEFLLCAEHDNLAPSDGVVKLVEQMEQHPELAAVGGLYYTKGAGGCAQIWGDAKDPVQNFRPQPPDVSGGLVECCGTGQGFTLFRLSMFKDPRLKRPWFRTLSGKEGYATQDLAFWTDARKYGYRCAIDCSVKVGHIDFEGKFGPKGMIW